LLGGLSASARPRLHALIPGHDVLVIGVERLSDSFPKGQKAVEQHVGQTDFVAGKELLAFDQTVQPGDFFLG